MPVGNRARALVVVASALVAACPVDDRTLTSPPIEWLDIGASGQDDGASGPDMGGAARAGADTGGTAGNGVGGARPGPGCGTTCTTLVNNGTFDHDTAAWSFDAGIAAKWSNVDASAEPSSGSLFLASSGSQDQDGTQVVGSAQCVVAMSGTDYHYAAAVQFDAKQPEGSAGIELSFFDKPNCAGTVLDTRREVATTATDWTPVATNPSTPAGTHSLLLRLVLVRPYRTVGFSASFDDVVLLER